MSDGGAVTVGALAVAVSSEGGNGEYPMYAYSGWYAGAPWSWMSRPSISPASETRRMPMALTPNMSSRPAASVAAVMITLPLIWATSWFVFPP